MIEISDIVNIVLLVLGAGIVILALTIGFQAAASKHKDREDMKKACSRIMQLQTTVEKFEKSLSEIEKKLDSRDMQSRLPQRTLGPMA